MLTLGEIMAAILKYCGENPFAIANPAYEIRVINGETVIIESVGESVEIPIER